MRRRKRLHEVEARYYIYQLVKACEYIHAKKVIHRDLKLGNLFLTERMQLKVGDFGLAAQVFYPGEKKKTVCGTPNYLAPEVLDANGGHSYEVDYWSIGVILYTMLYGRPPFESQDVKQTYKKIKSVTYSFPDHVQVGTQAKDFIRECLVACPEDRMNLAEMLQHDFLSLVPIPKQIPVSTLVCAPAHAFIKQFALPIVNPNALSTQTPSPTRGSTKLAREKRMKEQMLSAPDHQFKNGKCQKLLRGAEPMNINCDEERHRRVPSCVYSPLETNRQNSQCENGQIMVSARDGTPITAHKEDRLISEFDPLGSTAKKRDEFATHIQGLTPQNVACSLKNFV